MVSAFRHAIDPDLYPLLLCYICSKSLNLAANEVTPAHLNGQNYAAIGRLSTVAQKITPFPAFPSTRILADSVYRPTVGGLRSTAESVSAKRASFTVGRQSFTRIGECVRDVVKDIRAKRNTRA